MQSRLDDLRVVEHHQRTLRQMLRQVIEDILAYFTFIIYE